MTGGFIFYGLLPLVVFVLIDALARNIRWAIGGAVICSFAELFILYAATGRWDRISILGTLLFIALGFVSVKLNNKVYFKFQPVILAFIAAGFIGYLQFSGGGLIARYLPLLREAAPPLVQEQLENPTFLRLLDLLFDWLVLVILLDGLLIAYTALRCREIVWLLVNALGLWVLGLSMLLIFIFFLYMKPIDSALQKGSTFASETNLHCFKQ